MKCLLGLLAVLLLSPSQSFAQQRELLFGDILFMQKKGEFQLSSTMSFERNKETLFTDKTNKETYNENANKAMNLSSFLRYGVSDRLLVGVGFAWNLLGTITNERSIINSVEVQDEKEYNEKGLRYIGGDILWRLKGSSTDNLFFDLYGNTRLSVSDSDRGGSNTTRSENGNASIPANELEGGARVGLHAGIWQWLGRVGYRKYLEGEYHDKFSDEDSDLDAVDAYVASVRGQLNEGDVLFGLELLYERFSVSRVTTYSSGSDFTFDTDERGNFTVSGDVRYRANLASVLRVQLAFSGADNYDIKVKQNGAIAPTRRVTEQSGLRLAVGWDVLF